MKNEINAEHRLSKAAFTSGMDHAIRCGELLIQQKALLVKGEFIPWVRSNCEFSYESAKVYMLAARQKGRGLTFSSLKQLVERDRLKTQKENAPVVPEPLGQINFPSQPPDELARQKNHHPDALHYAIRVKNYLRWMVNDFRKINPAAVAHGALPDDHREMLRLVKEMHYVIAELHHCLGPVFRGTEPTPFDALPVEERHKAMWDVLKQQEGTGTPMTVQ